MSIIAMEAFQFAANNGPIPLDPLGEKDTALLADIRDILTRNGMEDRFGVSLLNKGFLLASNETTLESTNTEDRISYLDVVDKSNPELGGSVPTNWYFSREDETIMGNCRGYCKYQNYTHYQLHARN